MDGRLLGDMYQEWDLSFLVTEKISLGPLGNIASEKLQPLIVNHGDPILWTRKENLPGNEIELDMEISTIKSRAN